MPHNNVSRYLVTLAVKEPLTGNETWVGTEPLAGNETWVGKEPLTGNETWVG